jgi:hypothetical protein
LDEFVLAFADGLVGLLVLDQMVFIAVGIVVGKQDGAAGESRFESVFGGGAFSRLCFGSGTELGVGAVGQEAGGGDCFDYGGPFRVSAAC